MSTRPVRIPGSDHPITIAAHAGRIVVTAGARVIANTLKALTVREAKYPPVHYIPREDVDMSLLERTGYTTYCPYKGDCAYYSIPGGGEKATNAVWTYESPYPAVAQIAGYLAFYPDRVNSIEEVVEP